MRFSLGFLFRAVEMWCLTPLNSNVKACVICSSESPCRTVGKAPAITFVETPIISTSAMKKALTVDTQGYPGARSEKLAIRVKPTKQFVVRAPPAHQTSHQNKSWCRDVYEVDYSLPSLSDDAG